MALSTSPCKTTSQEDILTVVKYGWGLGVRGPSCHLRPLEQISWCPPSLESPAELWTPDHKMTHRYKVKPMAFLSLESRMAWGKRDVNAMSLAGVLTQGDRNLLMKGNHCCITSLCFDLVGKRLRWHLMPTRGGYVTSVLLATSSFERKLSEQVWLSWSCLFLEEHQLQTPLCAHPCSGGCPSPWKVGLEFPLVFCSDKALHWGKDASAFLFSGQPFL